MPPGRGEGHGARGESRRPIHRPDCQRIVEFIRRSMPIRGAAEWNRRRGWIRHGLPWWPVRGAPLPVAGSPPSSRSLELSEVVMTSVCLSTRFLRAAGIIAVLGALVLAVREAAADACGYPFGSGRTAVVFNESTVLRTFTPANAVTVIVPTGGSTGLKIRAFYSDEHALTLGAEKAGCAGTVASNSAISCVNVSASGVGCLTASDPSGRPFFPSLFLTDLGPISSPTGSNSGDWQQQNDPSNLNPTAIPPDHVCGPTKKASISTTGTITVGIDPAANGTNTGSSDPLDIPPGGWAAYGPEGYTAVVQWDIDALIARGLIVRGHSYRLQFMVHDGDQNKGGGDVGEGCTVVNIAPELGVDVVPKLSDLCEGTTVQLCAQIDPQNPGIPPYTYAWTKQSNPGVVIGTS